MNTSFQEWLKVNEKWDIIGPKVPYPGSWDFGYNHAEDDDDDDGSYYDDFWDDEDAYDDEDRRKRRGKELIGAPVPVRDLGVDRGITRGRKQHLPSGMHMVDPDHEELQNAKQYLGAEYLRLREKLQKGTITPEEKHLLRTIARKHIEGIYHKKKRAEVNPYTAF